MIVIAVVNLKGGSTKTTTTAHLGAAFHEADMRVLGVDADGENESLQGWQEAADLPWPVITLAVGNLHKQLPGIVDDRYDVVVIDTPPMQAQKGTVLSALRIATHAVVSMAPTPIEYDRLPTVHALIQESADLRPDGQPPLFGVLLTKCKTSASSPKVYRELITEDGLTVFKTQVGDLERFAQSFGSPIKNVMRTAYGDVAMELMEMS